jgi:hypothetical protein
MLCINGGIVDKIMGVICCSRKFLLEGVEVNNSESARGSLMGCSSATCSAQLTTCLRDQAYHAEGLVDPKVRVQNKWFLILDTPRAVCALVHKNGKMSN